MRQRRKAANHKTAAADKASRLQKSNSLSRRKSPTVKSYDMHLPKKSYDEHDSIYRVSSRERMRNETRQQPTTEEYINRDTYQISWKDDATGDDLLNSLVTFQTIFDKKPDPNPTGLSDLLEQGAQELRRQHEPIVEQKEEEANVRPEGAPLTLSFRDGPAHGALTLYHTMKMNNAAERMAAYGNLSFLMRSSVVCSLYLIRFSFRRRLHPLHAGQQRSFGLDPKTGQKRGTASHAG